MLSRNCRNCIKAKQCRNRFIQVKKGGFVYCPDGSRHLVDVNEEWIT